MGEEKLNFTHFIQSLIKRLWIIILFPLVAGLTSAYITYYVIDPVYQAEVDLLVQVKKTKDNPTLTTNIDDSLKLVNTYQDIIQSPFIFKEAEKKLTEDGHNIRIDKKDVLVENTAESQVLKLLVQDKSSTTASLIANAIASTIDKNIQGLTNSDSKHIKVINSAQIDPDLVSPKPLLVIGLTTLIAIIIAIWIVLFIENLNKHRKNS